jgi:hypothetical protein
MPDNLHVEILNNNQHKLLPWLHEFIDDFGLVGGTAFALQIGHRQSIDFDLFSNREFDNLRLQKIILKKKKIERVFVDHRGELTVLIEGVKITFLYYPFKIKFSQSVANFIKMPNLLVLVALKAYALGRRAKWKDYVDLYFILKYYHSLEEVIVAAVKIFGSSFNEKIFRSQLAYFKDLDYSESVVFQPEFLVSEIKIKKFLTAVSLEK